MSIGGSIFQHSKKQGGGHFFTVQEKWAMHCKDRSDVFIKTRSRQTNMQILQSRLPASVADLHDAPLAALPVSFNFLSYPALVATTQAWV